MELTYVYKYMSQEEYKKITDIEMTRERLDKDAKNNAALTEKAEEIIKIKTPTTGVAVPRVKSAEELAEYTKRNMEKPTTPFIPPED